MDFSHFDKRKYKVLPVQDGYAEWVSCYEGTVQDEMDLRLLDRLESVNWQQVGTVVDLACGTGRIGVWLNQKGVQYLDGVDFTSEMLVLAREKGVYRNLYTANVTATSLSDDCYNVCVQVLADEHLENLQPLYAEAARIAKDNSFFVLVGYHPYFLMKGIITHFHREDGEPVGIESYVHLFSDHFKAAKSAGWILVEMDEGIVDDAWLAKKPHWEKHRSQPVSFVMVWRKGTGI